MPGLPEHPIRPHGFFALETQDIDVRVPPLLPDPVRVRYRVAGDGPPLVLVHGLQTAGYSWRYVIEPLARHFRVYVPDLPGSGASGCPAEFAYRPENVCALLDGFRAALAAHEPEQDLDSWHVVGNSMGGMYCACYAALQPDRVRRLVVIHAPGFMRRAPFGLELIRRGLVPRAVAARIFGPWMVRRYLRYATPGLMSQEDVTEFGRPLRSRAGRIALWRTIREGLAPGRAGELPTYLARITAPTLLVWTREDRMIPGWTGERWHEALPGSELVWVADTSHFVQVDQPDRTVALVERFLA